MAMKVYFLVSVVAFGSANAQSDHCGDILAHGVWAKSEYSSNSNYRQVIDYKLSTMDEKTARSSKEYTGDIPIGDLVLGVGFHASDLEDHKSKMQNILNVDSKLVNEVSVASLVGDSSISSAWLQCMKSKAGASVYFSNVMPRSATLNVLWNSTGLTPEVTINKDFKLPRGVRVTGGLEFLNGERKITAGVPAIIQMEFNSSLISFTASINLFDERGRLAGSGSASIGPRLRLKEERRPYDFASGACHTAAKFGVDAPHNNNTTYAVTYCSDYKNGWNFREDSLNTVSFVAYPGQIANTTSKAEVFWSGRSSVMVKLSCNNGSPVDVQCHVITNLEEERKTWVID